MPGAVLIATQLTDHSTVTKTLTIGGQQVLAEPGGGFGTPIESITVTEAGPGGVSSMEFDIWDPSLEIVLAEGARVEFWDVTLAKPIFTGFLQSWSYEPAGPSRMVHVRCVGIEAVLDWMVVPSLTLLTGTDTQVAIQSVIANAVTFGVWLNAAALVGSAAGTLAAPIGDLVAGGGSADLGEDVVIEGDTVREAIRRVIAASKLTTAFFGAGVIAAYVTVDFWYGVRAWPIAFKPTDYDNLTISDTVGGAVASAGLQHETDAGSTPHQVYVKGGNAAGTGLVPDGSGLPGIVAFIDDATILASDARDATALTYLAGQSTSVRGAFQLEAYAPSTNIRSGSKVTLTDVQAGLSAVEFDIFSITKTFNPGGTENWTVAYGGHPKSAMRTTRRLTRDTRS